MSLADWLREQGREQGRIEGERAGRIEGERAGRIEGERTGRIEGIRRTLLRLLRLRFGELPETIVAAVSAAGPEQLDRWLDRAVTAGALNEVLAEG